MSAPLSQRVAVNPLPWVLGPDGFDLSRATLAEAFPAIAAAGFTAVHADVPAGMPLEEYRGMLADHGLRPAPGYFGGAFDDPETLPSVVEAARAHAATQLALGLEQVFIASNLTPLRIATPAVGAGYDADRLARVVDGVATVAEAITREGLTPCFHPHVSSWIETEHEVRTLLDSVDPTVLAFGPDTGHLFWAGADPVALVGEYADRVGAVHLKDVHSAAAERSRQLGADYRAATGDEHVWTEPGRGDVDIDAVLSTLPDTFTGWCVVEVDVPDLPTREESTAASGRWVAARQSGHR